MELFFSLQFPKDIKLAFELCVFVGEKKGLEVHRDKTPRVLSLDTLKAFSKPVDQLLFSHLVKEKRLSTDYSLFGVSKTESKKILNLLNSTFKVVEQGKVVGFDLFSREKFSIKEEDRILKLEKNGVCLSETKLFSTPYLLFFSNGSFHLTDQEIANKLIRSLYTPLENAAIVALKEEFEDEWQFDLKDKKPVIFQESPVPYLKLKDKTGAFADLGFYYGKELVWEHDPKKNKERIITEEKLWEEDFLKTGFIKKHVGTSHYFCPLDQVAKSLSCLIDLGWQIVDTYDRKVVKGCNTDFKLHLNQETIHLKGKVQYEDHVVDLSSVYGAFVRRQSFLDLGNQSVGLIDPMLFKKEVEESMSLCEKEGSISFNKAAFFHLKDFFPQMHIEADVAKLIQESALVEGSHLDLSRFRGALLPYQKQGVLFLKSLFERKLHGLLADEMGLGKTVQVIGLLSTLKNAKTLIVVPTSLLFHWKKEVSLFLPDSQVAIYHGDKRSLDDLNSEIVITTYGIVREEVKFLSKKRFDVLILDEAQAIKNSSSQIFQAVTLLQSQFRVSLSGTPLENKFDELWAHFQFLIPGLLGDKLKSVDELNSFQKKLIKSKIEPFILRRKKKEVLKELPEKLEQTIYVEMDVHEKHQYESTIKQLKNQGSTNILELILRLRQHCSFPQLVHTESDIVGVKFLKVISDIEEVVANNEKVVVYTAFVGVLKALKKELCNRGYTPLYLDGSTQNRQDLVDLFQTQETKNIFLISLKAGGTGLNLTAADYIFIYDPWWNESVENQAIDRAHRIGRQNTVIARRYVVHESIEEKILKLKDKKKSLTSEFVDDLEKLPIFELEDLVSVDLQSPIKESSLS